MNSSVKQNLIDIKLELITKSVENGDLETLKSGNFFKHYDQLIKQHKLSTGDRIWLGRRLKEVFTDESAPNPGGLAIFQKPDEFKDIRQWERETGWNGFSQTV